MKNIYKIMNKAALAALLLVFSFSSCDLDVEPRSTIATETYWKTADDAWYFLNTIYSNSKADSYYRIYGDMYSDDGYCQYSWEANGSTLFQQDGLSGSVNTIPYWNFAQVRKVNILLKEIDNCNMDNDLRERMKGEARFFRAYDYLIRTINYGEVPVITEVLEYDAPSVPRDPVEKVREFILDDLTQAAALLPEPDAYNGNKYYEKGRVSKYAALALKARAALYFGDYSTAEAASKQVIDGNKHSLFRISSLTEAQQKEVDEMDIFVDFAALGLDRDKFTKGIYNYESMWHSEHATNANPEFIYARQYGDVSGYMDFRRYTNMRTKQLGGWSSVAPTQNLVDAYWTADGKEPSIPSVKEREEAYNIMLAEVTEAMKNGTFNEFYAEKIADGSLKNYKYMQEFRNRDSRLYASVLFPFRSWYETEYGDEYAFRWIRAEDDTQTGFIYRKMISLTKSSTGSGHATGNFPIIRYAEVLLTYAEAHTQTTGYDASVQNALNDIRDRCGMPNVPASLSKEQALDLIREERRIELAAEGFRAEDLSRYDEQYLKSCMDNVNITAPDGNVLLTMKWSQRMRLKPLYQDVMDTNPLLKQNPGY